MEATYFSNLSISFYHQKVKSIQRTISNHIIKTNRASTSTGQSRSTHTVLTDHFLAGAHFAYFPLFFPKNTHTCRPHTSSSHTHTICIIKFSADKWLNQRRPVGRLPLNTCRRLWFVLDQDRPRLMVFFLQFARVCMCVLDTRLAICLVFGRRGFDGFRRTLLLVSNRN